LRSGGAAAPGLARLILSPPIHDTAYLPARIQFLGTQNAWCLAYISNIYYDILHMEDNLVFREVTLAFWKVHILHHAAKEPVYGQWIINELRRHGYDIKTGTLYPLLRRMEKNGWLAAERDPDRGPRGRVNYRLTKAGREVLAYLRKKTRELYNEVI